MRTESTVEGRAAERGFTPLPRGQRGFTPLPRGQRGFTLVEMTVSLIILVEIVLGALLIFDFNSKLARVQGQVTDMQQSLRISQFEVVRMTRMAGRGRLRAISPARSWPKGAAIEVRNNVGGTVSDDLAIGVANTPKVVDGTDVLTVRGVFTGQILLIDSDVSSSLLLFDAGGAQTKDPTTAATGIINVCNTTNVAGNPMAQDLGPLTAAIQGAIPEALVLSTTDDYAVVELNPASSSIVNAPACASKGRAGIAVAFNVSTDAIARQYQKLSNVPVDGAGNPTQGMPRLLNHVSWLGILEEYRYYVRQEYTIPGNPQSQLAPRLSRARMYPGTETPYLNDLNNAAVDIAENVLDLQVALGLDGNGDGVITDANSKTDEWLYNHPQDDPTEARWVTVQPPQVPPKQTLLLYARISVLARTGRADVNYASPVIAQIEDHVYNVAPPAYSAAELNSDVNRLFRRRLLQTVVGFRDL